MRAALFLLLATEAAGVLREVDPNGEGPRRHGAKIVSRVRGTRNKELLNAMGGGLTNKGPSSGNTKAGDKAATDKKDGALSAITKNSIPELTAAQMDALPAGDFLDMNVPFVADQQMSGDVDYKVHELERQLFQVISARDRQIVQTAIAEQEEKVAENVVNMAEVLKSAKKAEPLQTQTEAVDLPAAKKSSSETENSGDEQASSETESSGDEQASSKTETSGGGGASSDDEAEPTPKKKNVPKLGLAAAAKLAAKAKN